MNRLQKKCFIAAVGVHLLLLLILLVGPGFLHSTKKDEPAPPPFIVFRESTVTDALTRGGGDPTVEQAPAPPPPAPEVKAVTPPAPAPPEVKKVEVEPPPQPKRVEVEPPPAPKAVEKINPNAFTPPEKKKAPKKIVKPVEDTEEAPKATTSKDKPKKPEIEVDLSKDFVRKTDDGKERKRLEEAAAQRAQQQQANRYAKYQAQRQRQLDASLRDLGNGLSSSMNIEMPAGPGGVAFINYGQLIVAIYENAWLKPNDVNADETVVKATVTINHDGTIVSARITQRSGNDKVDRSVERTLRDVKIVDPFPPEAKESQRTFNIEFNLKTKRQTG